jgi:hypothetical protein
MGEGSYGRWRYSIAKKTTEVSELITAAAANEMKAGQSPATLSPQDSAAAELPGD